MILIVFFVFYVVKMIECNICGSKAIINKTAREHEQYSKLYCSCKNPKCGHKFVMSLTFSHSEKASLLEKDKLILTLIKQLPKEDQQKLMNSLID